MLTTFATFKAVGSKLKGHVKQLKSHRTRPPDESMHFRETLITFIIKTSYVY